MVSKKLFVEILSQIEMDKKNANRLDKIFKDMNNDFIDGVAFTNPVLTGMLIRLLDASFGEKCDWVAYWVYELDCGENSSSLRVEGPGGEIVKLETIEDLWDWCNELFLTD